jgi:hypothetical protein
MTSRKLYFLIISHEDYLGLRRVTWANGEAGEKCTMKSIAICIFTKYYYQKDKLKGDMGSAWSIQWKGLETHTAGWSER